MEECLLCQNEEISFDEIYKYFNGLFPKIEKNICRNHSEKFMKLAFG